MVLPGSRPYGDRVRAFRLLARRNFGLLWSAGLISLTGDWVLRIGLPIYVYQLTGSPLATSAMFMAAHLVNTFLLVAVLTLTAWWLSGGDSIAPSRRPAVALVWAALAVGLLLSGMSGAVAALGDTLYPAASHAEGLAATLSPSSHILLRLRALHPVIAVSIGGLLMFAAPRLAADTDGLAQRLGRTTLLLAGTQLLGGLVNLLLLAPVWMQMVHLLVADLLWIVFVMLGARVLRDTPAVGSAVA